MKTMNRLFLSFIFFAGFLTTTTAQTFEFGLNFGAGNYIGDIGREYYFYPNGLGGGIMFKNTVNPWYSVRINADYQSLKADDAEAESKGRQARGLSFSASTLSLSAGIEYYFIPYNPYRIRRGFKVRPYMFTGLGMSSYSGTMSKGSRFSGSSVFIPMRLGLKFPLSEHFLLGVETGANYYFTDNLDGTVGYYENADPIENKIIPSTNTHSNDWSTFTSISLIYTFGDLRCYFNL